MPAPALSPDTFRGNDVKAIYAQLEPVLDANYREILGEARFDASQELRHEFASKKTPERQVFLATYEVGTDADVSAAASAKTPQALADALHYQWLANELFYIAQKIAVHNHVKSKRQASAVRDDASASAAVDDNVLPRSIDAAIQSDRTVGVSLDNSFVKLRTMMQEHIEIVSTEHPTDNLSQKARERLDGLLLQLCRAELDATAIEKLLQGLIRHNAIPDKKRTVSDEIRRDMVFATERSYDAIPLLMRAIVNAYARFYADDFTTAKRAELGSLLTGLDTIDDARLVVPASWPGADGDGNANVNAATMAEACKKKRIGAGRKHIKTLNEGVVKKAKEIERGLRDTIIAQNTALLTAAIGAAVGDTQAVYLQLVQLTTDISQALSDRKFTLAQAKNQALSELESQLALSGDAAGQFSAAVAKQKGQVTALLGLVKFSGLQIDAIDAPQQGALQAFIKQMDAYVEQVNTDGADILLQGGDATLYMLTQLNALYAEHRQLIAQYPEVEQAFFEFGGQFRSVGMTYGYIHMRQNSPIFTAVWDKMWQDFVDTKNEKFLAVYQTLCDAFDTLGRDNPSTYMALTTEQQVFFFETLLMKTKEGLALLKQIQQKQRREEYTSDAFRINNGKGMTTVHAELARFVVIAENPDMFSNSISANVEQVTHYFESKALHAIFADEMPKPTLNRHRVVLLIETRQDLERYETLLTDVIRFEITQCLHQAWEAHQDTIKAVLSIVSLNELAAAVKQRDRAAFKVLLTEHTDFAALLKPVEVEIMFGYSDTERTAGLNALIAIDRAKHNVQQLAADFGVTALDFDGPGTDLNRGGYHVAASARKTTLQGIGRDQWLLPDGLRFHEQQFYALHQGRKPEHQWQASDITDLLQQWETQGAEFYEHLHDEKNGWGQLLGFWLGQSPHWAQRAGCNHSSRASDRQAAEGSDPWHVIQSENGAHPAPYVDVASQRAITKTQLNQMLSDNLHLVLGPGFGLRQLGAAKAKKLYEQSPLAQDIIRKMAHGLATANFDHARHALFAQESELLAQLADDTRRHELARAFETTRGAVPSLDIKAKVQTPEGRAAMMGILAQFFAYVQTEVEESREFLWNLLVQAHQPQGKTVMTTSTDLLFPWPDDQVNVIEHIERTQLAQTTLASAANHVNQGHQLPEIFSGLVHESPSDHLTGLTAMLGSVMSAIVVGTAPPVTYSELACNQEHVMTRKFVASATDVRAAPFALGAGVAAVGLLPPLAPGTMNTPQATT